MELYIQVAFWLGVLAMVINIFTLMCAEFPIIKKETLGLKVGQVLISSGFLVWAGFLLFAQGV